MTDTWTRVRFVIEPSSIGGGLSAAGSRRSRAVAVQPGALIRCGAGRPRPAHRGRRPDGAGTPVPHGTRGASAGESLETAGLLV